MRPEHAEGVLRVYREGLETGDATFETRAPEWSAWDEAHLDQCRFVAIRDEQLAGWAALGAVSDRCVYAGVAEISVYVSSDFRGQGIGSQLLERTISAAEEAGFWTLQAGIFPENEGSIALHRKHGFRVVGLRERLGQIRGVWRDVLFLERRSTIIGTD